MQPVEHFSLTENLSNEPTYPVLDRSMILSEGIYETTQLTDNIRPDSNPQTYSQYITWQAQVDDNEDGILDDWEIFLYDGTSSRQVTENDYDDINPQIGWGRITWQGYIDGNWEIFLNVPPSLVCTRCTHNNYDDINPRMDAQWTWQAFVDGDWEIFWYDGVVWPGIQLTDNDYDDINPEIDGRQITWQGYVDGNWEIFWDEGDGNEQLTANDYDDIDPKIDNCQIVWEAYLQDVDEDQFDWEVFLYDNETDTTTRLTTDKSTVDDLFDDVNPQIFNGKVTWGVSDVYSTSGVPYAWDYAVSFYDGSSTMDIWSETLSGFQTDILSPEIKNGRVTWDFDGKIWHYDGTNANTIGLPAGFQPANPQIVTYKGLVVFEADDGQDAEIFIAKLDSTAPSIDEPEDVVMLEGTDIDIVWHADDTNPGIYTITEDGNPVVEDAPWTSGSPIEYSLSHLPVGTHDIVCYVYDDAGNSASDSVTVIVEPELNRDFGYSVIEVFDEYGEPDGLAIVGSTIDYYGNQDVLLIRTDQNGNQLWNKTYGTALLNEEAYDIIQTNDLGFVLVGKASSETEFSDVLVFRVDSSGTLLTEYWVEGLPEGNEIGYAIIETNENTYAIAASTSDGPGSSGNWDGMFLLIDMQRRPGGSYIIVTNYMMTFGGSGSDCVFDIIQLDSIFMLTGYTNSIGYGGTDLWIVRLIPDSGSYIAFQKAWGGVENDYGAELVEFDGDSVAIIGSTSSQGMGGYDAWLVVTNYNGFRQFDETYGGPGNDYGTSVVACETSTTISNGFALGGYTFNTDTNSYDFWLTRTYADGQTRWSEMYGDSGSDRCESIIQTSDYGFAMVGTTSQGFESEVFLVLEFEPLDTECPYWIVEPSDITIEFYFDYMDGGFFDLCQVSDEGGIADVSLIGEYVQYFMFHVFQDGPTATCIIRPVDEWVPIDDYVFTIRVSDFYGHSIQGEFQIMVRDTRCPEWEIAPEDQYTLEYGDSLSMRIQAKDPSGVRYIAINDTTNFQLEVVGQTSFRLTVTINSQEGLQPGTYGLYIVARDDASTSNLLRTIIQIRVHDTTPPELLIPDEIFHEFGTYFNKFWRALDMSDVSWYLIDESGMFHLWALEDCHLARIIDLCQLPIGVYTLEVQVTDAFENSATATVTVTVQDTKGPTADDLVDNYWITYTQPTQIVLEGNIEDFSVIQYFSAFVYTLDDGFSRVNDAFSIVTVNSSDGRSITLTVFTMESLEKGTYYIDIRAQDIHGNLLARAIEISVSIQLQIELSGAFDYKEKEKIQISISAHVMNAGNNKPVYDSGINVHIYGFYDSNGNSKTLAPNFFEYIGHGTYLWTSLETVYELMVEGTLEIGIYTIIVEAVGPRCTPAYNSLSIHIDPPGVSDGDSSLTFGWVSFSGLLIANIAIVVVFLLKRRGIWRSRQFEIRSSQTMEWVR